MRDADPAPSTRAAGVAGDRDDQRPTDVDRRQRGIFVGKAAADVGIDALPIEHRRVDESGVPDQPWRRDRNHLDEQRDAGEEGDDVAPVRVTVAVPQPQPDQKDCHPCQMGGGVVVVARSHEVGMTEDQLLRPDLAREVHDPLGMPHPATVRQSPRDVPMRRLVSELPQGEQAAHERRFDRGRCQPDGPAAAYRTQCKCNQDEHRGHDRGALQVEA
jgi:hypothetical protein